jgi:hypothetical protein
MSSSINLAEARIKSICCDPQLCVLVVVPSLSYFITLSSPQFRMKVCSDPSILPSTWNRCLVTNLTSCVCAWNLCVSFSFASMNISTSWLTYFKSLTKYYISIMVYLCGLSRNGLNYSSSYWILYSCADAVVLPGFVWSHTRYANTSVMNLSFFSARVMYEHRTQIVSSIPVLTTLCDQSPTAAARVPPGFTRLSNFSFVVLNSTFALIKVFRNNFWALSRCSHLCHCTLVSFSRIPPAFRFLRRSTIGINYFMSP